MMSGEYIRFLWRTVVISRHSNHRENRYGRMKTMHRIIFGDNLEVLQSMPSRSIRLIYIDPPFNTGKVQTRKQLKTDRDEKGDRVGFKGYTYRTTLLVRFFGRNNFLNEIIWAYDYGARSKKRWPAKHDNILWYCKNLNDYVFNYEEIDRIPYMAPGLVGPEKAARGKTPTDTWWHTIVSPNGKEKTGYPTQKPLGIIRRIISASSRSGDCVLDFFAGSGTVGEAAIEAGRR